MNRKEAALMHAENNDERLLISYCLDLAKTHGFTHFLTPAQLNLVLLSLRTYYGEHMHNLQFSCFGGYNDAERQIISFSNCMKEKFPIAAIQITPKLKDALNHRDYLGSILGLGIQRNVIGDIVVGDHAVVFAELGIADYIVTNLTKVGKIGVQACVTTDFIIPTAEVVEKRGTVASLRLDAVVAFSFGISRETAQQLIKSDKVAVNHRPCKSTSQKVCEGYIISARGYGRVTISAVDGMSRKNRTFLTVMTKGS